MSIAIVAIRKLKMHTPSFAMFFRYCYTLFLPYLYQLMQGKGCKRVGQYAMMLSKYLSGILWWRCP